MSVGWPASYIRDPIVRKYFSKNRDDICQIPIKLFGLDEAEVRKVVESYTKYYPVYPIAGKMEDLFCFQEIYGGSAD